VSNTVLCNIYQNYKIKYNDDRTKLFVIEANSKVFFKFEDWIQILPVVFCHCVVKGSLQPGAEDGIGSYTTTVLVGATNMRGKDKLSG
jgi:hypothetical protein